MKKILLLIFVLSAITTVPYWIGVETERQFTNFNQEFYPQAHLKLLKSKYQRGWFQSVAHSTFATMGTSNPVSNDNLFTFVHKIEHGFLPTQSTLIHTTLYTVSELSAKLIPKSEKTALLEVHTTVQTNGDSTSTLTMPTLAISDNNYHLRWQGLQGYLYVKHNSATVQTDMHSPQIQFDTNKGRIVIQNVKLNLEVQFGPDSMQSVGSISIADLQLSGKQAPPVKLEGFKLVGSNNLANDNLMVMAKTGLQQIHIGKKNYGPGYSDFELRNWHIPTLIHVKNTLVDIRRQGLPPAQEANVAMFRLMPYGLALLKNGPEFATSLHVNTPDGSVRGALQVKIPPFDGNIFTLFDPLALVKILTAQLEMHIPISILDNMTSQTLSKEVSATHKMIGQLFNKWREKGILIVAEDQPNYYRSQMQLKEGILQVNGQQLPITIFR